MDKPLPSISLTTPAAAAATATAIPTVAATVQTVDASPCAAQTDGVTIDTLPPVPGAKLRLMCSYGGHIMPRPHDKALTYAGGDTRLVVVDRCLSLASLCSRLSRTLLNGRSFTLKYQLPDEDLDSLVSVTTDEDLDNMIEEYDRVTSLSTMSSPSSSPQRIRLFLFVCKLETAATMGSLLADAKSESWFVDALNGLCLLPRGLSDSAAVDTCLVNLEDCDGGGEAEARKTLGTKVNRGSDNKQGDPDGNAVNQQHEMQLSTMPDSPMVETASSSFGSSSSSPSMANLPPIRVRVSEDPRMEEQFAQMSFSNVQAQRQIDDGIGTVAARPSVIPPAAMADAVAMVTINNAGEDSGGGIGCQVLSDDERLDPGLPVGYRKPPLPLQPVAVQPRPSGGNSLPSPDSVASDSSISSATSFPKSTYYQDQAQASSRPPKTQPDTTLVQTSHIPIQPVPYPSYTPDQHHQQQPPVQQPYVHHPGLQYISQPSSYYPVYTHPVDPHHQHQHQHQHPPPNYPVYVMPVVQSQPYVSMQSSNADVSAVHPSRPLKPSPPTVMASSAGTPPLYPNSKPGTNAKPEIAPGVFRTTVTPNPQVLQAQLPQFVGYSQLPTRHAPNTNYGYEYSNPQNEAAYYHAAAAPIPLASQYQSMTPAAAEAALADGSKQMVADGYNPQIVTSQPL